MRQAVVLATRLGRNRLLERVRLWMPCRPFCTLVCVRGMLVLMPACVLIVYVRMLCCVRAVLGVN